MKVVRDGVVLEASEAAYEAVLKHKGWKPLVEEAEAKPKPKPKAKKKEAADGTADDAAI